ncbi:MAG: DUF91 domain-containing protein [bacterium]|nr:DUF91 domain-containing protein [bacterium]
MAVEMAIWRMTDTGPRPLPSSPLDLEQSLEDMLAEDPGITGIDLLVVGRQVRTGHGGFIDLLAVDSDGRVHVLELKRDRTPRDVVAQTLDYGSWAQHLGIEDLEQVYLDQHGGKTNLGEAFAERFDSPLPDVVNTEQQFTIIASELDPTSDRIVEYLAGSYGVPINAVFFRHFRDEGRDYLARTWLLDPQETEAAAGRPSRRKSRPWNGRDFYTVLGRAGETHRWLVARKYGFLNAGGGSRYWKPFQNLEPGKRVFALVAGAGYVGIGRVMGEMIPARDAMVEIEGESRSLLDQPELSADWWQNAASDDSELTEMVVPVEWCGTRSIEKAIWQKGLFASQHIVCKLRDENTIKTVESAFGLDAGVD